MAASSCFLAIKAKNIQTKAKCMCRQFICDVQCTASFIVSIFISQILTDGKGAQGVDNVCQKSEMHAHHGDLLSHLKTCGFWDKVGKKFAIKWQSRLIIWSQIQLNWYEHVWTKLLEMIWWTVCGLLNVDHDGAALKVTRKLTVIATLHHFA